MRQDIGRAGEPGRARVRRAAGWFLGLAAALGCGRPAPAAGPAASLDATFSGEIIVVLEDAVAQDYSGGKARSLQAFNVHVAFENGQVADAWGTAPTYNQAVHDVFVLDHEVSRERVRMKVEADVRPDMWVKGGKGMWEVEVARRPSSGTVSSDYPILRTEEAREELEGTFSGWYRGPYKQPDARHAHSGKAVGVVWPPRTVEAGFVPIGNTEHPRLLLRKADVEAMRRNAQTALGRAIIEKLKANESCIAQGALYQLTGDKAHAEKAYQNCVWQDTGPMVAGEHETHQSTWQARRLGRAALGFDLACDGWTDKQRTAITTYLVNTYASCLYQPYHFGAVVNPGTKADRMYAGGGLATLALWGTPGPEPEEPRRAGIGALQERFGRASGPTFEERHRSWQIDTDLWRASGGANPKYLRDAQVGRHWVYLSILAIGEGGTGGEELIYDYAIAYRNMFGRSVTGRADVGHAAGIHVLCTVWPGGRPGSAPNDRGPMFIGASRPDGNWFARAYVLAPAAWQPALWWYWLRVGGVTAEDLATDAGARRFLRACGIEEPQALVLVLAHAPLDLPTRTPDRIFPHVWENKPWGALIFRDAWSGPDSIVTRFYGKQRGGCDTGSFEFYGLGHTWIHHGGSTAREHFNKIELPDDPINLRGAGVITHLEKDLRTGSGVVTLNMDDTYTIRRDLHTTKTIATKDAWTESSAVVAGRTRTVQADANIRGLRAFAVDYSGTCGAPALFAVVDRVTGGGRKEWIAHMPDFAQTDVQVEGRAFTVTRGGATLRGVFAGPAGAKVERALGRTSQVFVFIGKYSHWEEYKRDVLLAAGADPTAGDFFVVMTLRRGPPPEIKVEGSGLGAKVTVGRRTVAFDGEKIVLGE
jgi:hypothetical protein